MNNNDNEFNKTEFRLSALKNNVKAINTIASSIEGTLGPRGMDCMIVDDYGNAIITNDGVTILSEISASHPAARLLINTVMSQEREVGDGTTTLTILAGTLLSSALKVAEMGVPIHKIIEGIKKGIRKAVEIVEKEKIMITETNYYLLKRVAYISAREDEEISNLIYKSAKIVGNDILNSNNFRLADCVEAIESTQNQVFSGVIIDKKTLNYFEDYTLSDAKIMVLDDSLDIDEERKKLLSTEAGVNNYLENVEILKSWAEKIVQMKVNLLLCDGTVNPVVMQILSDGNVFVVHRVLNSQLQKAAKHSGCKLIRKSALNKSVTNLNSCCGNADKVIYDAEKEQILIQDGHGKPYSTIIISASTGEVTRERERIAKDAASSLQFSIKYGIVPGGGALEIYISNLLKKYREEIMGMEKYGLDCVIEALKKPFLQMVDNSGFNSLEVLEKVIAEAKKGESNFISIDFQSGDIKEMLKEEIFDPAYVKTSAFKKAGEIAEAILKINLIIKGKS
ncbi:TCP-1/cpn60 chaperonin family protein [Paramaledivibacter caminithermalis]|jgi:chaperonin GroEL (HSP60 family)|uniref:Chaperonin GroEL (HSP60 family) n=1 Tax=Paramaledivibacter caminithermalis (strain DSM 15212 / CIP 107654 / DViRD3) TaxID=1121301 RepID=A0A1M6M6U3_PARC5|nr:TCP-1/cpn60 chaperonin family protein [Paramaledivibacter caminithermalis]SHJ79144.1 Chaperonin GroEL (HSP60 family) [Paramaledivibacter caminithermalis DSM 15212]